MQGSDHIDRQLHQIEDLQQWHHRKILTELAMVVRLYHKPIHAMRNKIENKNSIIAILSNGNSYYEKEYWNLKRRTSDDTSH